MRICGVLLLLVTSGGILSAQETARPEQSGTVTGHVFCRDTQRPARLAKVALVAAMHAPLGNDKDQKREDHIGPMPDTDYVETGLDGSFRIPKVKPGEYYLIVDKDGYTLPLGQFTRKELTSKDEAVRASVDREVKSLTVASDGTVNQEVMLDRGASVAGTVLYDDGSPASGLDVNAMTKDPSGKWEAGVATRYRSGFGRERTDDQGRYRITGLPPGEYVTQVELTLNEYTTTVSSMPGHPDQTTMMRMQKTRYSLGLFSGNQFRGAAAVPYKLAAGEDRTGADLLFPLSKLHKVTGQILAKDGHALNGAKVTLTNADDKSEVTGTDVDLEDKTFHLEFVPEGDFILTVTEAKDVRRVQVDNPRGTVPKTHEESRTLRTYTDSTQPLTVKGELVGVVAIVKEKAKAAQDEAEK